MTCWLTFDGQLGQVEGQVICFPSKHPTDNIPLLMHLSDHAVISCQLILRGGLTLLRKKWTYCLPRQTISSNPLLVWDRDSKHCLVRREHLSATHTLSYPHALTPSHLHCHHHQHTQHQSHRYYQLQLAWTIWKDWTLTFNGQPGNDQIQCLLQLEDGTVEGILRQSIEVMWYEWP